MGVLSHYFLIFLQKNDISPGSLQPKDIDLRERSMIPGAEMVEKTYINVPYVLKEKGFSAIMQTVSRGIPGYKFPLKYTHSRLSLIARIGNGI